MPEQDAQLLYLIERERRFYESVDNTVPLTISWSALKTHEDCRQAAKLFATGKKNPLQDIRSYFHGTVVDRVMRAWLNLDDPQPGEMVEMVEDMFREMELEALRTGDGVVRWRTRDDKKQLIAYCRELVVRLEPILYRLVIPYEYEPEKRFRTAITIPYLDGNPTVIFLAGGIDIVTRDDKQVFRAYDLKGTQNENYVRQVIGQGIFYDLSMFAMFGSHPAEFAFIQPMCKQQVVQAYITDADRAAMMARIIKMAHFMWRKDWSPKEDSKGCSVCAVRHACEKFKPVGDVGARRISLDVMRQMADQRLATPALEA